MIEDLEKKLKEIISDNGKSILLDTSFTCQQEGLSMHKILHHGLNGFDSLPIEVINEKIGRFKDTFTLSDEYDVRVISEVEKELQMLLNITSKQYKNIKRKIDSKRRFRDIRSEREYKLAALKYYSDLVGRFVKAFAGKDPRDSFNQEQNETYSRLFNLVDVYYEAVHHEMRQNAERNGEARNFNGSSLGKELQTDKKILTTAFTLSYQRPAIILTRDRGIIRVAERVNMVFDEPLFGYAQKEYDLPSAPKYLVSAFN